MLVRLKHLKYATFCLHCSARTPLPCQSGCSSPSTDSIPTFDGCHSNTLRINSIVISNECQSVYVSCTDKFVLATYNSFTGIVHVYDLQNATVYCGTYRLYYILYKTNFETNEKMCSNSFDRINCVDCNISFLVQVVKRKKAYTQFSASSATHTHRNDPYCIDDRIEWKILRTKIAAIEQTKWIYLTTIMVVAALCILIAIAQFNIIRLRTLLRRCLPESKTMQFIRHHEIWKLSHVRIDHDRCIGNGIWSNIYYGTMIVHLHRS